MGGIKLEIFRMVLYLAFPVGIFWVSNQADYFEKHVVQRKQELYPPGNEERKKEMEEFRQRLRALKEKDEGF